MMPGVFDLSEHRRRHALVSRRNGGQIRRSPLQPWRSPASPCSWSPPWRSVWSSVPGLRTWPTATAESAPVADGLEAATLTACPRLAGRCDHTVPECTLRVDLLALGYGEGDRHVCELVIPEADDHVGAPAEPRVDRALSEEQAERRVVRRRRHAPDRVAGIDVLESDFRCQDPFEVVRDPARRRKTPMSRSLMLQTRPALGSLPSSWPAPPPPRSPRGLGAPAAAAALTGTSRG